MKKVISATEIVKVVKTKVSVEKYYGALHIDGCSKGFIHREDWNKGRFVLRGCEAVTKGNKWDIYAMSLKEIVSHIIESGNFEVFEFDTARELFNWLGKP